MSLQQYATQCFPSGKLSGFPQLLPEWGQQIHQAFYCRLVCYNEATVDVTVPVLVLGGEFLLTPQRAHHADAVVEQLEDHRGSVPVQFGCRSSNRGSHCLNSLCANTPTWPG